MMRRFKQAAAVLLCLLSAGTAFAIERETDDVILRHFLWDKFTALPKNERPKIGVALSAGACAVLPTSAYWKPSIMPKCRWI